MNFSKNSINYSLAFVTVVVSFFSFLWFSGKITANLYFPILFAGIITTINFIFGIISIKYGLKKSINKFLILFLGGMGLRLALMLIAVFICLNFLELRANNFIFSVFIFYVFYQIIEIFYVIYKNK